MFRKSKDDAWIARTSRFDNKTAKSFSFLKQKEEKWQNWKKNEINNEKEVGFSTSKFSKSAQQVFLCLSTSFEFLLKSLEKLHN